MIIAVTIKERGFCGRDLIKKHKNASKFAWVAAGIYWHNTFRDKRFTAEHGRKAGYAKRQGEESGTDRRKFFSTYTGQKLRKWHHKRPLEWSGEVRSRVRFANITATNTQYFAGSGGIFTGASKGGGAKVSYPGASKLNYRRWPSSPRMADEFRRLLPEEMGPVGKAYDAALADIINRDTSTTVRKVA